MEEKKVEEKKVEEKKIDKPSESLKPKKTPSLKEKLFSIMEAIDYLEKDRVNEQFNYDYTSERTIKVALHKQFVEKRILFQLNTYNVRIDGKNTLFDCNYSFIDVDSDAVITGQFNGSGQSRDEKGYYAAVTGAIKYILTSTFLIPTGDDPENDKPTGKDAMKDWLDKINSAETMSQLRNLGNDINASDLTDESKEELKKSYKKQQKLLSK